MINVNKWPLQENICSHCCLNKIDNLEWNVGIFYYFFYVCTQEVLAPCPHGPPPAVVAVAVPQLRPAFVIEPRAHRSSSQATNQEPTQGTGRPLGMITAPGDPSCPRAPPPPDRRLWIPL